MSTPIIELREARRWYDAGEGVVEALRGVSLIVQAGEFVAIVGASGSGKSTLLGLVSGIDRPTTGEVIVAGQRIDTLSEDALARWRRGTLGIVFQFFQLLPTLTALENVLLPMSLRGQSDEPRARALLAEVGLAHRLHHLPTALSGGEQQRVAIARALANDPPLLLADEPTGNLDERTGLEVMALLTALPRRGKTLLLVTHDPALAARADRVIHMADGQIVGDTATAGR
ncbi:MAG: ABC transporter ATP-binding protein [Ardenticatenales bacterium]|nr:ABC transporter ATP-binding protein [Ardenticatenales bacterium]